MYIHVHVYYSYMRIAEHMMLKDGGKSSMLPTLYTHNMYICIPTV